MIALNLFLQQIVSLQGSPEVSGRMDVDTRDAGIPLQDGTIIALQHQTPSEQSDWAYFHVEQHGSGLGPLQPKAPFLLTPEQVCLVERSRSYRKIFSNMLELGPSIAAQRGFSSMYLPLITSSRSNRVLKVSSLHLYSISSFVRKFRCLSYFP